MLPHLAADSFGDPFTLNALPLPRPACGYAIQLLDTDQLLDPDAGRFLPIRACGAAVRFDSFDAARAAAGRWVGEHCAAPEEHRLAIVPVGFDPVMERHVLIFGVLCGQP